MQGDGPFPDGINVTIRRNYIYEDAYDKLSPENGTATDLHVHYLLCRAAHSHRSGRVVSYIYFQDVQQMLTLLNETLVTLYKILILRIKVPVIFKDEG